MTKLRDEISEAIGIVSPNVTPNIEYRRLIDSVLENGYTRQLNTVRLVQVLMYSTYERMRQNNIIP